MSNRLAWLLLAAAVFSTEGCSKKQAAVETIAPVDRVNHEPPAPPIRFHRRVILKTYERFEFTVPPHTLNPRLRGSLDTFGNGSDSTDPAIDVVLLKEEEFPDFASGKPGTVTYMTRPGAGEIVDIAISSTQEFPQKYYLVLNHALRGKRAESVEADFTVTFQ